MNTTYSILSLLMITVIQFALPLACIYTMYRIFKTISLVKFVFTKSCYYMAASFPTLAICFIYLYNYTDMHSNSGGPGEGFGLGLILSAAFGLGILLFIIGGAYHLYRIFLARKAQ